MSKKARDPWVRTVNVSDTVLHKKGYTLYKVTSKVFPKNSVEAVTEVSVWKRYNDFKKLHKALYTIHQNLHLKGTFPTFAKARIFGRFDDDVIEERKQSALQLLQFANDCPALFTSQVFVKFFEEGLAHLPDTCIDSVHGGKKLEDTETNENDLTEVLQPVSITANSSSTREEKECLNTLGGTWKHHQIPDNISLSSQHTEDEDDRTTFTDDDSSFSKHSVDLTEFDPLLINTEKDRRIERSLTHNDLCSNWLLTALQSCNLETADKDDNVLEVPTPFDGMEFDCLAHENTYKSVSDESADTGEKNFQEQTVNEFDPLSDKNKSLEFIDNSNTNDDLLSMKNIESNVQRNPSFIYQASKYVVTAQQAEADAKYAVAFEMYKKAIDLLLQGIQKNVYPELKEAIRKKVLVYLMHAEEIYENKLPKENIFNENSVTIKTVDKFSYQSCLEDLSNYKVLGILGKGLLVLNVSDSKTYFVKTLYKSSIPKVFSAPNVITQNIPFMVNLYQVYETSYAIFLLLEYASGGRLWDYVNSYLQRSPLSPSHDDTFLYIEPKSKSELSNVYSGKKILAQQTDSENDDLIDADLTPSENCPPSYVALFKNYAAAVDKEGFVSLAKYDGKKLPSVEEEIIQIKKKHAYKNSSKPQFGDSQNLIVEHKNSKLHLSSSTGCLTPVASPKSCYFEALDEQCSLIENPHLPESCVHIWAAEIILCLEALHTSGITWMDFHPNNILLGPEGHVKLTYHSIWNNVDITIDESAKENLYCAPEVGNIFPVTQDCDWWSLGAILYELLTGRSLAVSHPTGITRHTVLNFPANISSDAKDFISKLLQYNPNERLGSGIYGSEELKSHPFLRSINWESLTQC